MTGDKWEELFDLDTLPPADSPDNRKSAGTGRKQYWPASHDTSLIIN